MINKGFTIIEVLVSLVILALIAVISSNILQSSLDTKEISSIQLNNIKELNLSSSILRRDIRQIVNIPSRDFYGNQSKGSFIANQNSKTIQFTSTTKSLSNDVSPIKRVMYIFKDNNLVRRQYFSSNPYDQNEYIETIAIKNITELDFFFMYKNAWRNQWPLDDPNTKSKIPVLIKMEFTINGKNYTWLIEPNISYEF